MHIQSTSQPQTRHPEYRGRESLDSTSNEEQFINLEEYILQRKISVTDRITSSIDVLEGNREMKLYVSPSHTHPLSF